jgi:drug/metabolite transporter (DMT)-like permease
LESHDNKTSLAELLHPQPDLGSSYLFIRIGVEQLPPIQLVFMRTLIAAIGLNLVIYLRGRRLPGDWRSIGDLLFLGVVNTVSPFALIT